MRVLVDVTHPAHVHLFRHAIDVLESRGHAVAVASREKDVTTDLLDAYGIDHAVLSRKRSGPVGAAREWLAREARLYRFARSVDPDVVLSRLNPASAHVARLLGAPNVVFHDTEAASAIARVTVPFAAVVCTPEAFDGDLGAKQVRYAGYHELAYLHPARFERDPAPLREAGIDPEEPYAVLRFVSPDAHHDDGDSVLSVAAKRELVETLAASGDVHLVSEGGLPSDLEPYAARVPPESVHQLLAHADLFAGDSSTMAAEAGLLGTPTVRLDTFGGALANFEELATRYGLVRSVDEDEAVLAAVRELAADPDAGARWRRRRRNLLAEKIDVTAFVVALATEVGGA